MLSSALRVGHKPVARKKAREKHVEVRAQEQAPVPIQVKNDEKQPINWKHLSLGLGAIGVHGAALLPFIQFYTRALSDWLLSGQVSYQNSYFIWFTPSTLATDAGVMLSLLLSGWLFFKRQRRAPMLVNALLWLVLLENLSRYPDRASWPCVAASLATLATAFALGRRGPEEPETPIQ